MKQHQVEIERSNSYFAHIDSILKEDNVMIREGPKSPFKSCSNISRKSSLHHTSDREKKNESFISSSSCDSFDDSVDASNVNFKPSSLSYNKLTMDDFHILSVLGKGYYGKVLLVKHKKSKKIYAIKIIPKSMVIKSKQLDVVFSERKFLKLAKSPFIVGYKFAFQSDSKFYIGLEYVPGGELFYRMQRCGTIPIDQARLYVAEIAVALNYVHQLGYIYRDMKPENILLDKDGHVKLTDFGLTKSREIETHSFVGTTEYLAPEIVTRKSYGIEADFWALGIMLFEMLTENTPFYCDNMNVMMNAIVNFAPALNMVEDADARDLIAKLLVKDPKKRMSFKKLKKHKFFTGLDWDKVERKEYQPEYIPQCKNLLSLENFDKKITAMPPIDSEDENTCEYFEDFSDTEDWFSEESNFMLSKETASEE